MTDALLVALGAAVGAPLRWLTDRWVTSLLPSRFPWGTLAVNLLGSFVLGVVLGSAATGHEPTPQAPLVLLVGTGFCGAYTTFSTFSFETVRLLDAEPRRYAAWNLVVSLTLGCLFAAGGWVLGGVIGG